LTAKQYRRPRRPMRISDHARGQMLAPVTDTRRTPFTPTPPPPGVGDGRALMAMDDCPAYSWALQSEISEGLFFPGYPYLAELTQRPEYRRITEILAKDMTRRWVTVTATGDEKSDRVAAVTEAMRKFGIQEIFQKAAELDGFFGRGHIYVDTGATDNPAELETPLFLDKRKVKPGSVLGFRTVEPMWTYPNTYNSSDPLNATYYKPVSWLVMGKTVHRSRLLTFVSRPVPDILKAAYSFGGLSMSQLAKPYVDNWIRTRQSVSDLVSNYSKDVIKTNLGQVLNQGAADALLARAELYTRTRDNRGLTMVDMETEDFVNVSTPLSSLDKLQAQSQEQMASVAGIPLVVLLGITPSGLNASSDGEIKTYYAWIASQQEAFMSAPLKYIMDLIQLNEFGDIDDTIVANWNSLWEDDDTTTAAIRKTNADTDMVYVDGGVLSPEEVRERLAADRDSPYHGIDVTDVPEPPEPDLPDDGGEEAGPFATDAWEEGKHPRAANGQFGSGGGGAPAQPAAEVRIAPDKFNAAGYARGHDKFDVTPADVLKGFPVNTADHIQRTLETLAETPDTVTEHKRDGEWTPERKALHRKIMFDGVTAQVWDDEQGRKVTKHFPGILSPEAIAAAKPADGQAPTFTMLGGRGGSGKGWFKGKVYDPDKAIVLDPDHIKGLLPEYDGWNAAQVHEESGEIFDQITRIAGELGLNLVHDATMKSPEKAVSLVEGFKAKGYGVAAHYMHLPRQLAAQRAVHRFLGPTRRFVPPEVVLANVRNEESFDQVRKLADSWSFRDNNVPKGQEPRLISESDHGR